MEVKKVLIVGAGPAGLATAACLNIHSISNIVLEKEDCCGSLWKKRAYKRLKLHLPKHMCTLPHMNFPSNQPTFVPKDGFIKYLDDYASNFKVNPLYNRAVVDAWFDKATKRWHVVAKNLATGIVEEHVCMFLVVATGENSQGFIPDFDGVAEFKGPIIHSSEYESGKPFTDKDVLVVGSGNSGMEIAFDLANWDAHTSIVVRNPVHVLTKEMVQFGMFLLKCKIPVDKVDAIVVFLSKLMYGNINKYGFQRPDLGPFYLKKLTGRSPVIDVGTMKKIRHGSIQVVPALTKINEKSAEFANGKINKFDTIVFATGYKSTVKNWLKEDGNLFDENGMPKAENQNKWKGENGLYCVGFAKNGLFGISNDAQSIASDINKALKEMKDI